MADNVTNSAGDVIAADQLNDGVLGTNVKVQYVKLMDGTLDSNTKIGGGANGLKVDPSAVTSPVSLSSVPLATGASTSALQTTGNTSLSSIDTKLSSQATAANQTTGNTSVASIDTKTPTVGQKTMANSRPVVLPSDQLVVIQGTAADNALATGNPIRTGAKYNATTQNYGDGDIADVQVDGNGRTIVTLGTTISGEDLTNNVMGYNMKPVVGAPYAPGTYQMPATAVTKANIKAASGNLYSVRFTNANSSVRYLQLHNTSVTPAAAATAQLSFLVPAGSATQPSILELDSTFFAPSEYFSTGVSFAVSTTDNTFTDAATAAEHKLTVRYV